MPHKNLEERRLYLEEYKKRPNVIAARREHRSIPEVRERLRESDRKHRSKPEVKEARREYDKERYYAPCGRDRFNTPEYIRRRIVTDRIRNQREEVKVRKRELKHARYWNDSGYKIICCLRSRMREALNGKKQESTLRLIGCCVDFLKNHIESSFEPGMTWDNYGEWHIDHIVPISWFGEMLEDIEWQRVAMHWSNLRPMWGAENIAKGNRHA